jgi:hypothetical protein
MSTIESKPPPRALERVLQEHPQRAEAVEAILAEVSSLEPVGGLIIRHRRIDPRGTLVYRGPLSQVAAERVRQQLEPLGYRLLVVREESTLRRLAPLTALPQDVPVHPPTARALTEENPATDRPSPTTHRGPSLGESPAAEPGSMPLRQTEQGDWVAPPPARPVDEPDAANRTNPPLSPESMLERTTDQGETIPLWKRTWLGWLAALVVVVLLVVLLMSLFVLPAAGVFESIEGTYRRAMNLFE